MVYSYSRVTWVSVVVTAAQRMNGNGSERVGARGEEYVPESNNWHTEEDKGEFSFDRLLRNAKKHRSEPAFPFLCPSDHSHPRGVTVLTLLVLLAQLVHLITLFLLPISRTTPFPFGLFVELIVQNKSRPRTLAPVAQELIATCANEGEGDISEGEGRGRAVDASEVQPCLNTIFDLTVGDGAGIVVGLTVKA